jgi:hypothetical protein
MLMGAIISEEWKGRFGQSVLSQQPNEETPKLVSNGNAEYNSTMKIECPTWRSTGDDGKK